MTGKRRQSEISGVWRSALANIMRDCKITAAKFVSLFGGLMDPAVVSRMRNGQGANGPSILRAMLAVNGGDSRAAAETLYGMLASVRTVLPYESEPHYKRDPSLDAIGSCIRSIMRRERVTARELSKRSGVEIKSICAVAAGEVCPIGEILMPLLAALEPTPNDLDTLMMDVRLSSWKED